jgi:hypothetical protein
LRHSRTIHAQRVDAFRYCDDFASLAMKLVETKIRLVFY